MLELAEDELHNFFKVWATIFVSLSYCYTIANLTSKGFTRFFAIIPIVLLFLALPLKLTSFHLGGLTAFFIAWLANFKLLLFAFGKGPLCSNPFISFLHFLALSCFPIKILQNPSQKNSTKSENNQNPDQKSQIKSYPFQKNSTKSENKQNPDQKSDNKSNPNPQISIWNYIIKGALLALIIKTYDFKNYFHPKILWLIFCFHIYFTLELVLAFLASSARVFLGFELEPPFNEPFLSTSLQDFWGKRWNIMVTRILRPSVYLPTLEISTKLLGRTWAPLPAVMSTFLVSALMHEVIFYYLGREWPTFEVTWFFLLHGFCLCVEIVVKKLVGAKWRVPRWVYGPLTVGFVVGTGFWLFMPPLIRAGLDTRPFQEFAAVGNFVRSLKVQLSFMIKYFPRFMN
ncbi:acyl-CoA--sterol O-acyltransferase 1-like [Amaranthus tricolor]|uniref:acyl-CoA--sterol O-acyltransferase 1-like n=1 Tax=Amaranthus tricolor TaxID=29722 RepID=UPI002586BC74|nr:acyl-CoA--sterol O-acyltransferase 1-like [Amaranthus tricolor]